MAINKKTNYLKHFLTAYFYFLENDLNNSENGLNNVKFQSEEANTDEYLKKYFQNYILENNGISKLGLKSISINNDNKYITIEIEKLKSFKIINVFLPEQLSVEQKQEITDSKNSVYTNPDLFLEINDGRNSFFESLELKSTKNNNIPGSSVQQVSPFEWVIFVKRNKESVDVSTGYYINSITEKLPFPDRSPRPQIAFKTLTNWNKTYRKVENNNLKIEDTSSLNEEKIKILTDWQNHLASEWLDIIKLNEVKNNEKWFNNALRKFAVKFLEYSETLSNIDKKELKNKLNDLIK
ncbi:hypothetical protein G1J88_05750 [Tenacibaculum dicentrarchi]|uniref:hypothetical protein n=1 Tax=Tenacibaculum dicentrarchi TaxID=669041 RepID=UPI0007393061|nr:hypothetical protein AUW17_07715 [Tenacibaculum dicentrarchi]MCD8414866.1 hypothetical protein [Tenacibaculum dicentrarchi]MCD8419990.1 hypothetical protein [Tenacibaculum dicentrarchi]MCD8438303.1 hypothetical protein [Tenacibaculum dicentrarchi]MCG8827894.1 hypothetical protein [Tenacibaculum dicentrarchi]